MFRFSSMSRLEKLQFRLTAGIALALLVTVFIILLMHNASNLLAEQKLRKNTETMLQAEAKERMKANMQLLLSGLANPFNDAFRVGTSLAEVLKSLHESGTPREIALTILRSALNGHHELLGVYAAFEPDAFDGKDEAYRNQSALGSDHSGRFLPYFNRIDDSVRLETLTGLDDSSTEGFLAKNAWYTCPKQTLKPCTLGPIFYTVQDRTLPMLTQVVPMIKDNRFMGLIGVDIPLTWIAQHLKQIAGEFPKARVTLLNEQGMLVGDSSDQSPLLSKAHAIFPEAVTTLISHDNGGFLEHEGKLYFHMPFTFGALKQPWHLLLEMPHTVFQQQAVGEERRFAAFLRGMSIKATLVSLIVIALATVIVTYLSRSIFKEVRKLTQLTLGASESVSTAAREIAQGNNELAQRTEHQASGLEEVAASVDELTATSKQTSEHAGALSEVIEDAEKRITEGRQVLEKMTHSVADLEKSQRRIGEIISMIDEISFQTNLLALNAAVEAARAGEHGRSFAVVAQEVRRLAVRASEMSRDISRIINVSLGRSQENMENVGKTAATMNEIFYRIDRLTTLSADIASASIEQSRGINEIHTALSQLDEITQQNMALVEEIANSASHLRDMSTTMERSVRSLVVQTDPEQPGEADRKNGAIVPHPGKKNAPPDMSPGEWREL
jgi:methyl-accepting chemotaxis protein